MRGGPSGAYWRRASEWAAARSLHASRILVSDHFRVRSKKSRAAEEDEEDL